MKRTVSAMKEREAQEDRSGSPVKHGWWGKKEKNIKATVPKQHSAFIDGHAEELCSKMKYPHGGRNEMLPAERHQSSPHLYDWSGGSFLPMRIKTLHIL